MDDFNQELTTSHLYWIGGSPCGGKSSVSDILANQCGFNLYRIDDQIQRHLKLITPFEQPALSLWQSQTWEERWMQPIKQLLDFVITAYTEHFQLCLKEILAIPSTQPTLIEGNPITPSLIEPYLASHDHAIWLIAQDSDLTFYYQQREWALNLLSECSDPQKAFLNWMDRDIEYAHYVKNDCTKHSFPFLMSDRSQSILGKSRKVAAHFHLPCDL